MKPMLWTDAAKIGAERAWGAEHRRWLIWARTARVWFPLLLLVGGFLYFRAFPIRGWSWPVAAAYAAGGTVLLGVVAVLVWALRSGGSGSAGSGSYRVPRRRMRRYR